MEGNDNQPYGWRLFAFILVFFLFPIILGRGGWRLFSILVFALLMKLVFPDILDSK